MKKFAFSLERILEYRRQLESDRKLAFSKAAEIFRRREDQLRALAAELADYRTRLARMGVGKISAREFALYRSYLTYLEAQAERAVVWLHDAGRDLEARRSELAAASKDTQVLEKVKQVKRAEYDYQANREETAVLDEIGSARFVAGMASAKAEEPR